MTYVKVGEQQIEASITAKTVDHDWDRRESRAIKCALTNYEALALFTDNVKWSIIDQPESYVDEDGNTVTPEAKEYDNSVYSVAGDVIDHRNGTVTIKMGKPTADELLAILEGVM